MPRIRPLCVSVSWRTAAAYLPSRSGWTSRLKRTSPRLRVGGYAVLAGDDPARRSVPRPWCGRVGVVTRVVHVPYVRRAGRGRRVVCLRAAAPGRRGGRRCGPTAEAAVADLRDALEALLAEVGPPDELTLTLDVA